MEIEAIEMLEACRDYLQFVIASERVNEAPEERNTLLACKLDRIAFRIYSLRLAELDAQEEPTDDAPQVDGKDIYKRILSGFSDLGQYPVVYPASSVGHEEIMAGDAIDDLRDIYLDLNNFVWAYENASTYWAIHHLQLMYRVHWGQHLRDLQSYLFSVLYR